MASTFCCSITPFGPDGAFDEAAVRGHFRRVGDAGIGVYAGGSSPGEQYAMTPEETEQVLRIAVEELKGRVPVRAMGVEARHAPQMIEFARLAERSGVEALQIYSLDVGHGSQPEPTELDHYFRRVLEATDLPAVLSSHFLGGYVLSPELLESLLDDHPQILGLNVSTNDIGYVSQLVERLGERVELHVGGPLHGMSALAMGATGFLSAESNVVPRLSGAVVERWNAGDYPGAFESWTLLMRVYTTRPQGPVGSVRWLKTALAELGLPGGALREPNLPLPAAEAQRIRARLEALGALEYL